MGCILQLDIDLSAQALSKFVARTIMEPVTIHRTVEIHCNGKKWRPDIVKVGDIDCVKIPPNDRTLVQIVAAICGIPLSQDDMKKRPSLTNVEGFVKLQELRNQAQASELNPPQTKPQRRLFGSQEGGNNNSKGKKAHRAKRSHQQMSDLRSSPQLFDIKVSDAEHDDKFVCLQRPIKHTDMIVVKLDETNLYNCLGFVTKHGIEKESLFTKRAYQTSGQQGIWKYGKYMYSKKTGDVDRKRY